MNKLNTMMNKVENTPMNDDDYANTILFEDRLTLVDITIDLLRTELAKHGIETVYTLNEEQGWVNNTLVTTPYGIIAKITTKIPVNATRIMLHFPHHDSNILLYYSWFDIQGNNILN